MLPLPPRSTLFPYTTLFRSNPAWDIDRLGVWLRVRGVDLLTTRHLRELVHEADPKRYSAFVDSVFLVYDSMNWDRSEEHTSELQSHSDLVCRLLLEKKKYTT